MEKKTTKLTNVIDTETFGGHRMHYYFDIKKASNNKQYLRITRRDQNTDESYRRTQIIFFEDDLSFFVEAITMLLGRHATGNAGASC